MKEQKDPDKSSASTAIHFSLQGKGGVGKSLVATLLAQYFGAKSESVRCIDADPVNHTFAQYKKLNVQKVKLLRDGGVIDPRGFDGLVETLLKESGLFVVDSGAATFLPLWNYILEHNIVQVLNDAGRQ